MKEERGRRREGGRDSLQSGDKKIEIAETREVVQLIF